MLHYFKIKNEDFLYIPEKKVLLNLNNKEYFYLDNDSSFGKRKKNVFKIYLIITEKCNMRCKYCYKIYKNNEMSFRTADEIIHFLFKNLKKNNINYEIRFFGGEPLLKFDIVKFITKEIRKYNQDVLFKLSTNGTLLSKNVINFLKKYNFLIKISLDGNNIIHNSSRKFINGTGSYEHILKNISYLLKNYNKSKIYAGVTFTTRYLSFEDIISSIIEMGITNIKFQFAIDKNLVPNNHIMKMIKDNIYQLAEYYLYLLLKKKLLVYLLPFIGIIKQIHYRKQRKFGCGALISEISINHDGDIYPCNRFIKSKNFIIGDVVKGIKENIYINLLNKKFHISNFSDCSNCWLKNLCGGYCKYSNLYYNNNIFKPFLSICEIRKIYYKIGFWLYYKLKLNSPNVLERLINYNLIY